MTIEPNDASSSLDEIASVERRTREALFYSGSSLMLIVWGVLVTIGYLVTHFDQEHARRVWWVLLGIGMASNFVIRLVRTRAGPSTRRSDIRFQYAILSMIAFGIFWSVLITPDRGRELAAFWPTLFMLGYVIAGFWVGRFYIYCGVLVTALTMVGYFWLGQWFYLWMAVVSGGSLIAGGLWLRRVS